MNNQFKKVGRKLALKYSACYSENAASLRALKESINSHVLSNLRDDAQPFLQHCPIYNRPI